MTLRRKWRCSTVPPVLVVRAVPVSTGPSPESVRASRDISAAVRHEGLARVLRNLEGSVFGTVAALERERYGTVSAAEAERYGGWAS